MTTSRALSFESLILAGWFILVVVSVSFALWATNGYVANIVGVVFVLAILCRCAYGRWTHAYLFLLGYSAAVIVPLAVFKVILYPPNEDGVAFWVALMTIAMAHFPIFPLVWGVSLACGENAGFLSILIFSGMLWMGVGYLIGRYRE